MTVLRKFRLAILFFVLAGTVGCDQTSKHIARKELSQNESITIPGGLGELRLAENLGSFLSFGSSLPKSIRSGIFIVGSGLGLIALLAYLAVWAKLDLISFVGLAAVTAGGLSNLIDRITQSGRVTDFIFIRVGWLHTGVFNMADSVIVIGVALLMYASWKARRQINPSQSDNRKG